METPRRGGRKAIYRAACGATLSKDLCPAHLGDLAYFAPQDDIHKPLIQGAKRDRQILEQMICVGDERWRRLPEFSKVTADEAMAALAERERILQVLNGPGASTWDARHFSAYVGWQMSADLLDHKPGRNCVDQRFYRGYQGEGYTVALGKRRSSQGFSEGRRAAKDPVLRELFGERGIQGQLVVPGPGCRIRCPEPKCAAWNQLDWPQALSDPQNR
jgi:hypothetical protein